MIDKNKKLHRRESNPGRKRERLECYQLHHNGLLNIREAYVQQDEHIGLACLDKNKSSDSDGDSESDSEGSSDSSMGIW